MQANKTYRQRIVAVLSGVPHVRSWNTPIHQGGRDTGSVVGGIQTVLVTPRWLRFLRPHVFVTVSGVDDVETWVPGAQTAEQARAVHDRLVARYRKHAQARRPVA